MNVLRKILAGSRYLIIISVLGTLLGSIIVLGYGAVTVLTLPAINGRGFFLHPARLPIVRLDVRVEAVCPEAFPAEADVSLCPRVHANAFARILRAAL